MTAERGTEGTLFKATHILQGDDVGMLSISQQDLHLLRRVSLGFVDDLQQGQTVTTVQEEQEKQTTDVPPQTTDVLP